MYAQRSLCHTCMQPHTSDEARRLPLFSFYSDIESRSCNETGLPKARSPTFGKSFPRTRDQRAFVLGAPWTTADEMAAPRDEKSYKYKAEIQQVSQHFVLSRRLLACLSLSSFPSLSLPFVLLFLVFESLRAEGASGHTDRLEVAWA